MSEDAAPDEVVPTTFDPQAVATRFAVVDATGRVVRMGECQASLVPLQAFAPGEVSYGLDDESPVANGTWRKAEIGWSYDPPEIPLATIRAQALLRIDAAAEAARLRFLTAGSGQAMEYTATEAEARRYQAAPEAPFTKALYPFLFAEIEALQAVLGDDAPTPQAVAAQVIDLTDAWTAAGAEIKRLRREAKLRVEAATTPESVRAAVAVAWPHP